MPGKVNPVIPEYVMQLSHMVFAHDVAIEHACAMGNLELNQLTPMIVHLTLKSIKLLKNACRALRNYILKIEANEKKCAENLERSVSNLTPLIKRFGYERVAKAIKDAQWDIDRALILLCKREGIDPEELKKSLNLGKMTGLGYI